MADTESGTRLFVHLSENQDCFVQYTDFLNFAVKLLSFAAPFSNAAENRDSFIFSGNIMDKLHNENGLSDPGTAEQPGFAAALQRRNKVNDLYTGVENFGGRGLFVQFEGFAVDGAPFFSTTSPLWSISPNTLNTLPSKFSPTGTLNGPPVSATISPRFTPWEV